MDKLEQLKQNLYNIANSSERLEMDEIFAMEIEIPQSNYFNIDSDPEYTTVDKLIEDFMTPEDKKEIGLE